LAWAEQSADTRGAAAAAAAAPLPRKGTLANKRRLRGMLEAGDASHAGDDCFQSPGAAAELRAPLELLSPLETRRQAAQAATGAGAGAGAAPPVPPAAAPPPRPHGAVSPSAQRVLDGDSSEDAAAASSSAAAAAAAAAAPSPPSASAPPGGGTTGPSSLDGPTGLASPRGRGGGREAEGPPPPPRSARRAKPPLRFGDEKFKGSYDEKGRRRRESGGGAALASPEFFKPVRAG
jgi:hypothetical protein